MRARALNSPTGHLIQFKFEHHCKFLHPAFNRALHIPSRFRSISRCIAEEKNSLSIRFTQGTKDQQAIFVAKLLSEKLNFLALQPSNFVVAMSDDQMLGFGQLKSISSDGKYELCSLFVERQFRSVVWNLMLIHKSKLDLLTHNSQ